MSSSLSSFLSSLPPSHREGPTDYALGFFNIFLTQLALTTPYTPGWKLFRVAVAAPVISGIWLYLAFWTISDYNLDQWGVTIFLTTHTFRTIEWLVLFPAEENVHRLRPKGSTKPSTKTLTEDSNTNGKEDEAVLVLVPEPIPPPFTLAKFYWAGSLWWSFRGIGWNFCCPLPASSREAPYTRGSSRRQWFITNLSVYISSYLVADYFRTYQDLSVAKSFFHDVAGIAPAYSSLTTGQRAVYSIATVVRVWWSLISPAFMVGSLAIAVGGYMGWEGELWTPWGWPPIIGNLLELWRHPGLSTMWSRTWQGYNRRFLYVLGWIFLGEKVLGLTHTGLSAHPTVPPSNSSSRSSPNPSGQITPSHPLPTKAPQLPTRKLSPGLMLQNLIKSLVVFGLSGIHHDIGTLGLFRKFNPPGTPMTFKQRFLLAPFFVAQPVALAVEAAIKTAWRGWKVKVHPGWKRGGSGEPAWLVFLERALGFAWTWVWLGWTAGWFVEGMANLGAFRQSERHIWFSVIGGLQYGKWFH